MTNAAVLSNAMPPNRVVTSQRLGLESTRVAISNNSTRLECIDIKRLDLTRVTVFKDSTWTRLVN